MTGLIALTELSLSDRETWSAISSGHSVLGSPFFSYDFCAAVQAVRGGVFVAKVEDACGSVGYLPVQFRDGFAKTLGVGEKVGAELSDYFGIIAEDGYHIDPAVLLKQNGLNVLRFDHLPEDLSHFRTPGTESSKGLKLDIGLSGAQYFATLLSADKSFVKNIERGGRQLERDLGPLRYEWDISSNAAELERVVEEKARQYDRTHVTNPFKITWKRDLLFRLAQAGTVECRIVLSVLFAGSTWVASHLGLVRGSTLHSWFPVYNPELRRFSPGHVLMARIISTATEAGIRFVDFGQGDSSYKRKYRPAEYVVVKGSLRRRNAFAMLDRCMQSLEWRLNRRREEPNADVAD